MPTALVQGRIAAPYAPLLVENLGPDWEVLVWDPRTDDPADFAALAARPTPWSAAASRWTRGRPRRS